MEKLTLERRNQINKSSGKKIQTIGQIPSFNNLNETTCRHHEIDNIKIKLIIYSPNKKGSLQHITIHLANI